MKRMGVLCALTALFCVSPAGAQSISLCDYVSPETNLSDLGLSLSYRYFDDRSTAEVDESGGRLGLAFSQLYDSPDFGFTLDGSAEVLLAGLSPAGGLADGAGTFRLYLLQDAPVFGFGGLEALVGTGRPQPGINLRAGVGYGRFSDVTPMAKALTIDAELRKAGAISEPLGGETLMSIAQEIGRSIEYASVEELAAEVVSLIQTATGVTLTPRQVLMVEDVILAVGDERRCGLAIEGGLGYQLMDPYGEPQDLLLTVSADAAFAPDPESQLLLRASFSSPFRIMEENVLSLRASYDRTLSETSTLLATYSLQRIKPLGGGAGISHAARITVNFTVGNANTGVQFSLSKATDVPAWTVELSVSATMDLF
ncbi:MAG: hypothetical protein ACP5G2_00060 [Candidatus Bipolaricaulaceae bacterium]